MVFTLFKGLQHERSEYTAEVICGPKPKISVLWLFIGK